MVNRSDRNWHRILRGREKEYVTQMWVGEIRKPSWKRWKLWLVLWN